MKFGFGTSTEKNGTPRIERVAAKRSDSGRRSGADRKRIRFARAAAKPVVRFGEAESGLSLVSANRVVARVPDGAPAGLVSIETGGHRSEPFPVSVAMQIADNLQPVANPAVDSDGNTYVTFSGPRGARAGLTLQSHVEF